MDVQATPAVVGGARQQQQRKPRPPQPKRARNNNNNSSSDDSGDEYERLDASHPFTIATAVPNSVVHAWMLSLLEDDVDRFVALVKQGDHVETIINVADRLKRYLRRRTNRQGKSDEAY